MRRRLRTVLIGAGLVITFALVAITGGILVLRSAWFHEKLRQKVVGIVETATGGRVEIGALRWSLRRLTAEIEGFVIRGREPVDGPPLFRADSIRAGVKIVSILKKQVDIESLDVRRPQVYLIIYPDGRTNVPEPKVKKPRARTTAETILDLAINRFSTENGTFEIASQGKTPFDAKGENFRAQFAYDLLKPQYQGSITVNPLDLRWGEFRPVPLKADVHVDLEKNRVEVSRAILRTKASEIELRGVCEELRNPRAAFQYRVRAAAEEVGTIVRVPALRKGTVLVVGSGRWTGSSAYSATGDVHATGVLYRAGPTVLEGVSAAGQLDLSPQRVHLSGLRVSGSTIVEQQRIATEGEIASVAIRKDDIEVQGIQLVAFGGTFQGNAQIRGLDRFLVAGQANGLDARTLSGLVTKEPPPWTGRISGPVSLEGSLKSRKSLRANARVDISPEPGQQPVRGHIEAAYDARAGSLDLGRSSLSLPNTTMTFSGAIGRRIEARLESRNLDDFLPALGVSTSAGPKSVPIRINNGVAIFQGSVTGGLQNPQVTGHVSATHFSFAGRAFDSGSANVEVSKTGVAIRNGTLARKLLVAQMAGSLGLENWKPLDSSPVSANMALRNASVAELAALADQKNVPVTGVLSASATADGTYGDPRINGEFSVIRGTLHNEPYDIATARILYNASSVQLVDGRIAAGSKLATLQASFTHPAGVFDRGRVSVQVTTNPMRLDHIQEIRKDRPGVRGTLQLTGTAAADIQPAGSGVAYRITSVNADLQAHDLQMNEQTFGDATVNAKTEGQTLTAHLESDFANSAIRGDGRWSLSGDYAGSARVVFSKLDFARLRNWLAPPRSAAATSLTGFAEGQLDLQGPALKPEQWTATLRIPQLRVGPAPGAALPLEGSSLVFHNSRPIVINMAKSVFHIESVGLAGRNTDVSLAGDVFLQQKNQLDLRVKGRLDLTVLQDFNKDITSAGLVLADATMRGTFGQPLLTGQLQLKNAALSLADFPNAISNANGAILFNGNRATLEDVSGESGGGKIQVDGFVAYGTTETVVRLHSSATEVRVRYPEGVSTVADADLNLTGTLDRSMLAGTVTVVRTGFNPHSDVSSIVARSSEPVRTPAARSGFLGGLNFDVQIETAPDITVQSSLAQDMQVDANMRLRGTASNPALLGRVNITQGELVFFGTKYNINEGSVAFYNPVKIEPILNIDLETKARGIDITLTVSGPLSKLNVTPRSDPPLQFSEIVALLATGRAPKSDATLLANRSSSSSSTQPQTWQQMGATALVGQAIANPVAGRLQRFFGVSRLKIDPTLTGVENNPQARLTLEQQVTKDITFTYITNVTQSNPLVIRVEWALNKQWSVIAVREENGLFGIDFQYKTRFK